MELCSYLPDFCMWIYLLEYNSSPVLLLSKVHVYFHCSHPLLWSSAGSDLISHVTPHVGLFSMPLPGQQYLCVTDPPLFLEIGLGVGERSQTVLQEKSGVNGVNV